MFNGSGVASNSAWRRRKSMTIRCPRSATSAMVRVTSAESGRRKCRKLGVVSWSMRHASPRRPAVSSPVPFIFGAEHDVVYLGNTLAPLRRLTKAVRGAGACPRGDIS